MLASQPRVSTSLRFGEQETRASRLYVSANRRREHRVSTFRRTGDASIASLRFGKQETRASRLYIAYWLSLIEFGIDRIIHFEQDTFAG